MIGAVSVALRLQRRRRLPGMAQVGLVILVVAALVAVLAPVLAPDRPTDLAAAPLLAPSAAHLLGTNDLGEDILSQLIYGARDTLLVAVTTPIITLIVGTAVGVSAALAGGWVDRLLMRIVDAFLAVPRLPVLVLIAATAGPHLVTVILSIALLFWPFPARVLRAQTLSLRTREFLTAARLFGASPLYLARRHLIPALSPILVSSFVSIAGHAVLLQAGLAFLGLADPNGSGWGLMMNQAINYQGLFFGQSWAWWLLPPGIALTIVVLGFTFVGVGMEPRLNPRVEQHLA